MTKKEAEALVTAAAFEELCDRADQLSHDLTMVAEAMQRVERPQGLHETRKLRRALSVLTRDAAQCVLPLSSYLERDARGGGQ